MILTLLVALGLAAAFANWRPSTPRDTPPAEPAPAARQAESACASRSFEGSTFTVCKFDRRTARMEMMFDAPSRPALRSFAALEASLGARAAKVRFAVNAGMFDEDGAPIGLFVEDGVERRSLNLRKGVGNFHLLPNGVFAQGADGRVHVVPSPRFAARVPAPRWATQSGPMLVVDGKLHAKFDADGDSRLFRNGVGVSDESTAWFAISEGGVSFGKFARLFRDALGCPNALFLDGSVSSLWDPAAGRQDDVAALGPMIVVTRR